jgi:hypothetical protein
VIRICTFLYVHASSQKRRAAARTARKEVGDSIA